MSDTYEVIALSSPDSDLSETGEREKVRTIPVMMKRKISPLYDLRSLFSLIRVFRREKPYMIHSMTPKAGLLSMMAAYLTGVPVRLHSFTGLVFPTSSGVKRKILMMTDRLTCLFASHILAEGEGVRYDLEDNGITKKKINILGYGNMRGIDLEYFDRTEEVVKKIYDIREKLKVEKGTFVFVFVGRLNHDKGIDELIFSFRNLVKEGYDIRLLLVGEEEICDPLLPETSEYINNSPLVLKTGWIKDVRPYYGAADSLVFPSHREGFPNVVIEAGAMGLPSIVTDINGSREIILNEVNGIIIPSNDSDSLMKAMKRFIENREEVKKLASTSRKLIADRFEQSFVRSNLKEYYHEILNEP